MDREKIIGVLYILTFLLAAYVKFTNPHFFATNSSKGIHDGSNVTYLGQVYEDRLIWNVPITEATLSLTLWREVYPAGEQQGLNQNLFSTVSDSVSSGIIRKCTFVLKKEGNSQSDQSPIDRFEAVHLYPYSGNSSNKSTPNKTPELELGLLDKFAQGTYKVSLAIGEASNISTQDTVVNLADKDVGKIFFSKHFDKDEIFQVRVWKKIDIELPEIRHKMFSRTRKKTSGRNEYFYNLNYDELVIDLDKGHAEKTNRTLAAKDREVKMKLLAENSKLTGTYSLDVTEMADRIHFDNHIFEIAPKVDFAIVYPDFSTKPEQLAGVPYRDFAVTTQPMDGFKLIISDYNRSDTVLCTIENDPKTPVVHIDRGTGIEKTPGFQIKANQDRKIVLFEISLKSPKNIQFIARAGQVQANKSWEVPIRRLAYAVWPPIQPRYWHAKENDLYKEFSKKYPTQTQHMMASKSTTPLLYEGREVSVYYDVENVSRESFTSITLRFSNNQTVSLKKGTSPIEFTLPVDINWVELTVKIKEVAFSSTFAVKSVPDEFTCQVDMSPPLEMVTEYGMSTFQVHDYFGEAIKSDAIQVDVTGLAQNLIRMNKEKNRVKLELVGIKNNHNIRARLVLVQSPYSRNKRNVEVGKIALKN